MNKQEYAESFGRMIEDNEVVFDVDDRNEGFEVINDIGISLYQCNYNFKMWYAKGQKSPHIHVKNIQGLEGLDKDQLKEYKKLFIIKHCPKEYLKFLDIQICGAHRIATENELHYKYNTIKKLFGVYNEDKENFAEPEMLEKAKLKKAWDGISKAPKGQIAISQILTDYKIKFRGKMAVCPWHADKAASLSFSDEKGIWNCFGCEASGNIFHLIGMLEELKNG